MHKTKFRVGTVAAVFVATAVVVSLPLLKLGPWQKVAAVQGAPACGTVQVAGSDWLSGHGVDVHSNGQFQTTGTSCVDDAHERYDLTASPAQFGFGWQCVELVNRLYASKGWFPKLWLDSDTHFGAKWLFTYAQNGKYAGLTAHLNGSGYHPVPGDMIVHSNGAFGHVSVVDRIEGGTVYAVEQNNSVSGRAEYSYDESNGSVSRAGATISGFIHAEKNVAAPASGVTSTAENGDLNTHHPYVKSDNWGVRTSLRTCDHATPDGVQENVCFVLDSLADGQRVTMWCWRDTSPPPNYQYPRWFYVSEGENTLHPGWSGWVYAELVKDQSTVPVCTDTIVTAHPIPDLKPLVFSVTGHCTASAGELTAVTSGFTPGGHFTIDVTYPPSGWMADHTEGIVGPDGTIPWRFQCVNGHAVEVTYAVWANDEATDRSAGEEFIVPVASPAPKPPKAPTTTNKPVNPGLTQNPPVQQPPVQQPPTERTITVFNQVTNGMSMREDTPAYLSTITHNYCRRDGCMLGSTEVGTGNQLIAVCQVRGDRTTNGNDHDAADDANPQRYESTLWYGVRWADGRFGYISEVWIQASNRGGLGLRNC